MSKEYIISACSGMKIDVKQGQSITVIDIEGGQVVDFFAEADGNENEFLSAGVTTVSYTHLLSKSSGHDSVEQK